MQSTSELGGSAAPRLSICRCRAGGGGRADSQPVRPSKPCFGTHGLCLAAGRRVVRRGTTTEPPPITRGNTMSSDAIVLLKADHKEIRRLFREFQAAGD